MATPVRSEDEYGQKVDRCLYNATVKFVGGVGIGIVCSALLFKRRPWPLLLGSGVGLGMGLSDCNHEFRGPVKKVASTGLELMSHIGGGANIAIGEESEMDQQEECIDCKPLRGTSSIFYVIVHLCEIFDFCLISVSIHFSWFCLFLAVVDLFKFKCKTNSTVFPVLLFILSVLISTLHLVVLWKTSSLIILSDLFFKVSSISLYSYRWKSKWTNSDFCTFHFVHSHSFFLVLYT